MTKRTYKIQPPEVWAQVRQDYLSGQDAKTVAARHGVTVDALRARATKQGWSRHPRTRTLSPRDAAALAQETLAPPPDETGGHDPADLARAAAQASGRALHAQDFA